MTKLEKTGVEDNARCSYRMNNKLQLSGTLLLFPEAGFRARDSLLSSSVCLRLAGWLKHCNSNLSLYVIRLAGWLKHCSLSLSSSGSAVKTKSEA